MTTLKDYKDWLQEVDIADGDYESPSQLTHALRNECECGLFKVIPANGTNNGWIISAYSVDDVLHLKTRKQLDAFITHIKVTLCEGMDPEAYESYKREMMKND